MKELDNHTSYTQNEIHDQIKNLYPPELKSSYALNQQVNAMIKIDPTIMTETYYHFLPS